jgi:hypothetical protein
MGIRILVRSSSLDEEMDMRHKTSDVRHETSDFRRQTTDLRFQTLILSLMSHVSCLMSHVSFHSLLVTILSCALCLGPCVFHAAGRDVGTSGSAVLKIGVGARPTSMGEASVAVAGDVSSIYWNPAGLVQIRNSQLSAMHIEWFDDIRYEWVGYAQPVASWGTVAADISYVHTGSIVRTIESPTEGYEENGTFTAADIAGRFALAGKVFKGVLVGASFQVLQSRVDFDNVTKARIGDKTAQSTSINLGVLYNTPIPDLTVGGCFQNWGAQTQAFISEKEPLPFAFRVGAAYKVLMTGKTETAETGENVDSVDNEGSSAFQPTQSLTHSLTYLLLALDLDFPADDSVGARMGAEYLFGNGIAIRAGYRTGTGFDFPSGLCAGAGYGTDTYQLDYALVPYGDIGSTHRISFTVRF